MRHLTQARTMKLNKRLNEYAKTLNDGKLLAKLSAGDVVAQELKYHGVCLAGLYNRERSYLHAEELRKAEQSETGTREAYPIAFSELVTYITETKAASESSDPPIFRLGDLCMLYKQRLNQLVIETPDIHATRLKGHRVYPCSCKQIWRSSPPSKGSWNL